MHDLLVQSYNYDDLSSSASDLIRARHAAVSDGSKDIGKLLSATNRTLKVSKSALSWRAYVDFIQELVIQGLASSIIKTLEHLTNQVCCRPTLLDTSRITARGSSCHKKPGLWKASGIRKYAMLMLHAAVWLSGCPSHLWMPLSFQAHGALIVENSRIPLS